MCRFALDPVSCENCELKLWTRCVTIWPTTKQKCLLQLFFKALSSSKWCLNLEKESQQWSTQIAFFVQDYSERSLWLCKSLPVERCLSTEVWRGKTTAFLSPFSSATASGCPAAGLMFKAQLILLFHLHWIPPCAIVKKSECKRRG